MEDFGTIMNFAMPFFVTLFLIEQFFEWKMGAKISRGLDSVSSFSSGLTNVTKDALQLGIGIISYDWLSHHIAIVQIEATWLVYLIAFMVIDFKGYWTHRWEHKINFFWNRHVIHHSSEEYNLACALRQNVSAIVGYFTFLLIPAAFLGVPTKVIAIVGPLHLFLQFWYHTRLINKMGWLEYIIVTPSHHRVHHAVNKEYMDKNLGQIFIFWDKLFGTFQAELPEVSCVYGISRPARTWNPIKINFQHVFLLIKDAWHAQSWWDKIRIWVMPTGWRPADVAEKFPIESVKDPYTYEKYDVQTSQIFVAWSWIQMFFNYSLLVYFFAFIAQIGAPLIFIYGAFIGISVYAYTELMDKNRSAMFIEIVKSALGLGLIFWLGDWFGATERVGAWVTYCVAAYFVLSAAAATYFATVEFKSDETKMSLA